MWRRTIRCPSTPYKPCWRVPDRFFLDRSLGGKIVPGALRAAGWQVVTIAEMYGKTPAQHVLDPQWIRDATAAGLALLTADRKTLSNPLELEAIEQSGAVLFTLPTGSLTGPQRASRLIRHEHVIHRRASERGPAGYVVYDGIVSRVFP